MQIIVTNLATKPWAGWCETVVPSDAIVGSVTASFAGQPAYAGEQVGVRGRRAYFQCPPIEPVRQFFGDLSMLPGPDATFSVPTAPDLPQVRFIGMGEVDWTSDVSSTDGPCTTRRVRGRMGPFVISMHAWRFADEPWTRFEMVPVHSTPTDQSVEASHGGVALWHASSYVHVAPPHLEARSTVFPAGVGVIRNVYPASTLANGQGHSAIRGFVGHYLGVTNAVHIVSMLAMLEEDITALPINAWDGHFGPYGKVPKLSPSLGNGGPTAVSRYSGWLKERGFPDPINPSQPYRSGPDVIWLDSSIGMPGQIGRTGAADDFGMAKGQESISTSPPSPFSLQEARQSGMEEWRRPIHYREADGSPVHAALHPQWRSWGEQTHFHPSQSPDRLGKAAWSLPMDTHGFDGRDNQHHSSLRMCSALQLDGSRIGLEEINDHVEHWIAHVFDGAGRARGRMLQSGAWYYLLSARTDMLDAIVKNVNLNDANWPSKEHPEWQVRVSNYDYPDMRQLGGAYHWWNGFNEGLAAPGFWAAWLVTRHPLARELAKRTTYSHVRWAWFKRGGPDWKLCYGIRYRGFSQPSPGVWLPDGTEGMPLDAAGYADPGQCEDGGQGFHKWAYGAVRIAQTIALEDGDAPDVVSKASEIIEMIRASRTMVSTFDELDDWMAIA